MAGEADISLSLSDSAGSPATARYGTAGDGSAGGPPGVTHVDLEPSSPEDAELPEEYRIATEESEGGELSSSAWSDAAKETETDGAATDATMLRRAGSASET